MRKVVSTLCVVLGLFASLQAKAGIYSDLWFNPNESGWGVNISQQYKTIFATIFLYGADGKAKFYAASGMTTTTGAVYSGDLFETSGSYFGATYNPSAFTYRKVGTMTFTPTSNTKATLVYSVDGVNVTKSIQRQTWASIPLGGSYAGSMVVRTATSGCAPTAVNTPGAIYVGMGLEATATPSNSTFSFLLSQNGSLICTFRGNYAQAGSVFSLTGTPVGCNGTWNFADIVVDDDGISGDIQLVNGSCTLVMRMGMVRR
jgi:hypothetical protein